MKTLRLLDRDAVDSYHGEREAWPRRDSRSKAYFNSGNDVIWTVERITWRAIPTSLSARCGRNYSTACRTQERCIRTAAGGEPLHPRGLRILNAQTAALPADYQFDFNPGDTWKTLNVAGSPRQRTITDSDLYDQMEAMLLEPMSGGVWTGTAQYNIAMLSGALQYRRDELLLLSNANVVNLLQTSPVLSVRTYLPDSTLNLSRVRWIPVDSSATMPYALGREDVVTRNAFGVNLPIQPGEPDSWMITANTPLSFDVSCPPNQAASGTCWYRRLECPLLRPQRPL